MPEEAPARILNIIRDDDVSICRVALKASGRNPKPEEIEACSPYLDRQISIIMPDIIVCLGRHSAKYILSKAGAKFKSILSIRGKINYLRVGGKEIRVIATIHPAAALYRPPWKKFLVEDFSLIKNVLSFGKKRVTLDSFF